MKKAARGWKAALADPLAVEELRFDAKELPKVRWPAQKVLPPEIGRFVRLRKLEIRATRLGALCPELGTLPNLESLSLHNADTLLEIGPVLGALPRLRELELYDVGMTGFVPLPATLERLTLDHEDRLELEGWVAGLAALPALRSLRMADHGWEVLPDALLSLDHLEELDLSGNRLTALPDGIARLARLKRLRLANNPLRGLPDTIGALRELTELDLSVVPLDDLPPSLVDLPLQKLWVEVPDDVLDQLRQRMPACEVVARTRADIEREARSWIRFFGG